MLDPLVPLLVEFLREFGLWAFFAAALASSALVPVPSWVVIPLGGFLASRDFFPLWSLILTATLGSLVGSLLAYQAGRRMDWLNGIPIIEKDFKITQHFFDCYGPKTVFFGQIIPSVRMFIALPAGMARVPVWEFSVLAFLGALVWNTALGYAGFLLGENWGLVDAYGSYVTLFMMFAVPLAYLLYRHHILKRLENI